MIDLMAVYKVFLVAAFFHGACSLKLGREPDPGHISPDEMHGYPPEDFVGPHPPTGNIADWPYQRGGLPNVFIHWHAARLPKPEEEEWRYLPIFATLGQAFWELGASVALTNYQDRDALKHNITLLESNGVKPLIFVIKFWASGIDQTLLDIKDKAHIILYQSEPIPNQFLRKTMYKKIVRKATVYNALEVWDYSKANMKMYARRDYKTLGKFKSRLFPPGAATFLNVGVPFVEKNHRAESVAFLGQRFPPAGMPKYKTQLKTASASWIVNNSGLRDFLVENPVQFVYHRFMEGTEPVEAFRASTLLMNKACVISQISDSDDEQWYEGLVVFNNDLDAAFDKIKNDVLSCQTTSHNEYKRKFAPMALLESSGFLENPPVDAVHPYFTPRPQ